MIRNICVIFAISKLLTVDDPPKIAGRYTEQDAKKHKSKAAVETKKVFLNITFPPIKK